MFCNPKWKLYCILYYIHCVNCCNNWMPLRPNCLLIVWSLFYYKLRCKIEIQWFAFTKQCIAIIIYVHKAKGIYSSILHSVAFPCRRGVLFYILQLFLLTFALATAARPDLPLDGGYRDPIDIFRGICEAVILLITVVKIGTELLEFA